MFLQSVMVNEKLNTIQEAEWVRKWSTGWIYGDSERCIRKGKELFFIGCSPNTLFQIPGKPPLCVCEHGSILQLKPAEVGSSPMKDPELSSIKFHESHIYSSLYY